MVNEDSFLVPEQGGGERFFCKFASVEYRGHLSKYAYAPHVLITYNRFCYVQKTFLFPVSGQDLSSRESVGMAVCGIDYVDLCVRRTPCRGAQIPQSPYHRHAGEHTRSSLWAGRIRLLQ